MPASNPGQLHPFSRSPDLATIAEHGRGGGKVMVRKSASPGTAIVAIPVRNEVDRIGPCLAALLGQQPCPPTAIVLLLNNCDDGTDAAVAAIAAGSDVPIHALVQHLPPNEAHAGTARRLALGLAARLADGRGVLLTTDADSVAPPDWLAANRAAIDAGADVVAGRAVIDPHEAALIPFRLHEDDARECAYDMLLDEIHAVFDPDPNDPWPRHTEHSGASLALRAEWLERVGGVPAVPNGEDRAFVAALRRHDARIRHAPEVWVTVSGRLEGRAVGGMADTMRRRMTVADAHLDDRLEPARMAARRARLRGALRPAWHRRVADPALARAFALSCRTIADAVRLPCFGTAWEMLEQASPVLRRVRVPITALHRESRIARAILAVARAPLSPAGRYDIGVYVEPLPA